MIKLKDLPEDVRRRINIVATPSERTPKERQPNKTERAHMKKLEVWRLQKIVVWYAYEPMKIKCAPSMYYIPDFAVLYPDNKLYFHEVKGPFIRDRALHKVYLAAKVYEHFNFWVFQYDDKYALTKYYKVAHV